MRYVVSDIHGNYNLLVKMLKKINFSKKDTLYVLGDFIDKGKDSIKLLKLFTIQLQDNVVAICGNHEYEFIKFVNSLIKNNAEDEDILIRLKQFLYLREDISIKEIDYIMNLPFFVEENDYVLVHAGVPFDENMNPIPPQNASHEDLVYDRRFKNPNFLPPNYKCVIFGHTPSFYLTNKTEIIKYQKPNTVGDKLSDYYKIQIDTGNYLTGVLGCMCLDTLEEFYVSENEN